MIRMIQSNASAQAKAYFSDALAPSDYYMDDQERQGQFKGKLAERLGVKGPADKETFFNLCDNIHPVTGKPLTPRNKESRITGYDINFHCPKSVSILHALAKDDHILDAFGKCVEETMRDIEQDAKTRVRKDGVYEDRETGELLWGEFVHQTARPVEGYLPDPHLHSHCFVFNATWDAQESRVKAAKFRGIKRDMPYYQARFHKRLADKMAELGYGIRPTKNSFEIEGVPQKVIDHFSKRTDEIGRVAKEKGITDAKAKDALGAKTRAKKQKGVPMKVLKEDWKRQIRELNAGLEPEQDKPVRHAKDMRKSDMTPEYCINQALLHEFERASVKEKRRLLETAHRFALGQKSVSLDRLEHLFESDSRILQVPQGERTYCTTEEVLNEEKRMVDLAKKGRKAMAPLYELAPYPSKELDEQQQQAINHVMTTRDRVSIITGRAGAGKTKLMREAVNLIYSAGKKVTVVAPTAQASRGVLKDEGFNNAETVAKLLIDKKLQEQLKGQVLWVDEAGLLGTKDMANLLDLATRQNARIILGGDTRQHSSVVRGDALRILNTVGGIRTAEVSQIHRQIDPRYKQAVEDLAKGNIASGFDTLDRMGAIQDIDPAELHKKLVDDYMKAIFNRKTALVISPTHKEGDAVTAEIRNRLKGLKRIGLREINALRYTNRNLTEAEKKDWRNYGTGDTIQFNQNTNKIKRGSIWNVAKIEGADILIRNDKGSEIKLPKEKAKEFDVFEQSKIPLSKGDKIRITRNGFDTQKKRIDNGAILEVASVSSKGDIHLRNNKSKRSFRLDRKFGHIAHAHCLTSYAAQGKTVDEVFIAQPSSTFGATDAKQFYVSASRGKEAVHIYTDDREELLAHASEIGDRQSAMELVAQEHEHLTEKARLAYEEYMRQVAKEYETIPSHERDYEPEF